MKQIALAVRHRQSLIAAFVGSALALNGLPVHAQTAADITALQAQIAALQARLDKIEAQQKAAATSGAAAPLKKGGFTSPVYVTALLQDQYNAIGNQKGVGAPSQSGFRLRRAEVRVSAPNITDRIGAQVMFDPAKDPFSTSNANYAAGKDTLTNANDILQDFILTYRLGEMTGPAATYIDAGQFKIPLGYEGDLVSSSALETTERAQIFRTRDIAGAGYGDIRDQGVRLRGSFDRKGEVGYDAGVFQGLGERQNDLATGTPKAFVGRLIFRPANSGFQAGISGSKADTRSPLAPIATGAAAADPVLPLNRNFYNGFLVYNRSRFGARAEYTNGRSDVRTAPGTFKNASGYYGLLTYQINPKWQLVGRYDWLRQKLAAGNGTSIESTLGLNYFIKGNNAKIQTDLVKVDGEANAFSTVNSIQLRSEFQVAF